MIYDINGNLLHDDFSDNMELDYAYDATTNVNYSIIRVFQTKRDGTKQYPFIRYPGRMTAEALAAAEGWSLITNAGLGVSASQPIDGIAIQNGAIVNNDPASYHIGAVPLTIDANGNLSTATANTTASSLVSNGIVSATCGFCPIIENFEATSTFPVVSNVNHFNQNAQRTIIGQFNNGDYALIACAGRRGTVLR